MAMDASWDNGGLPTQKKGMPLWVKILAGCGIVAVLILGTCVGAGVLLMKKGGQAMQRLTASEWAELRSAVDQMRTEDGAKAFYAAHPALASRYPSEEAFLAVWKAWAPALEPLPQEPPSITSGRFAPQYQNVNGFKRVQIIYVTESHHTIRANWQNGTLVDLTIR